MSINICVCDNYCMDEPKPKRPRGRPKLTDTATAQIHVRVTLGEKEKYRRAAEKANVGISTWLKALADRESSG